jgi:hypothetical protein
MFSFCSVFPVIVDRSTVPKLRRLVAGLLPRMLRNSSCGIYDGQSGTGAAFLKVSYFGFPCQFSFHQMLQTHLPSAGDVTKWNQSHPTLTNNIRKEGRSLVCPFPLPRIRPWYSLVKLSRICDAWFTLNRWKNMHTSYWYGQVKWLDPSVTDSNLVAGKSRKVLPSQCDTVWPCTRMWRRIIWWKSTDVLEESVASIFRAEE